MKAGASDILLINALLLIHTPAYEDINITQLLCRYLGESLLLKTLNDTISLHMLRCKCQSAYSDTWRTVYM